MLKFDRLMLISRPLPNTLLLFWLEIRNIKIMENRSNFSVSRLTENLPFSLEAANQNVGEAERMASSFGGAALTVLGLLNLNKASGWAMFISGGGLLFRGLTGYCPVNEAVGRNSARTTHNPIKINETIEVEENREVVYQYWRQLENLPNFMHHLQSVRQISSNRSHWEAKIPGGIGTIEWDARITEERPNEKLSWHSEPGADVHNSGEVVFQESENGGTTIQVKISYIPPQGEFGAAVAKLFNPAFERMIRKDVERFGEIMANQPTTSNSQF